MTVSLLLSLFHCVDAGYDVIFLPSVFLRRIRSLARSCKIVARTAHGVGTSVLLSAGVTAEYAVGTRR